MSNRSSDATIAARYATAIFSLVVDAKKEDAVIGEISDIARAIDENAELRDALANPLVSRAEKANVLEALAKKGEKLTAQALATVSAQGRGALLPMIAKQLRAKLAAKREIVTADVESARALSPAMQKQLITSLEKATGKTVELNLKENPELLGGVAIQIGSKRLDATLSAALNTMRGQLLAASNA